MASTWNRLPLRAFNWLSTNKFGIACTTVGVLCMAGLEVYEYWRTRQVIYAGFAVFMLALIVKSWVQVYKHRNDPSWPPKLRWVPRDRAE
jgi:hypothetical protein